MEDIAKVFIVLIFLLGIYGWIANIVKIVTISTELAQWGVLEVFRIIGIFIPLIGAVLGFV